MLYFHSKLPDLLRQEIYASLILYNYGIFIANEAASENSRKPRKCTYKYEIDIAKALKLARKHLLRPPGKPFDVIKLMMKHVHAVKEKFRCFPRPLRAVGCIHFNYR